VQLRRQRSLCRAARSFASNAMARSLGSLPASAAGVLARNLGRLD
jgi:hypothetical protein